MKSTWRDNNDRVEAALVHANENSKYARVACPFCEDDGHRDLKRSLSVRLTTGRWKCFRCERYGKLPGYEADDLEVQKSEEEAVRFEIPTEFCKLHKNRSETFAEARSYLRSRGVREEMWRELNIMACDEGYWAGRIIIPHYVYGECLGWVARFWKDVPGMGAYMYPPGMDKGRAFFNQEALEEERSDPVLVVEGVFDAIPYWPNAVACMGKPAEGQVDLLHKAKRPVVIALDGDAWQAGWSLAAQLRFRNKVQCGFVKLPPRRDPATVDRKWLWNQARRSLREAL